MSLEMFKSFAKGYDKVVNENKKVWGYTRVSSKDQEANKSLKNQSEGFINHALSKKFIISKSFGNTYESASGDFTRKEFMKLITEVRESSEKPYAILLNTISRFSRTGGGAIALAYELVEELGVHFIEVSTGKSTETEDGKLEIYRGLLHAKQENIDRLRITMPGMKKFLEEGNWLGRVPRGYDHYGPRVKGGRYSETQKITISEEGKKIQLAWQWKLQGERDFVIEAKLNDLGLKKITKQLLSEMWRNPFYCGICSQKMLDGKVVEGNWEKMVSDDDFLTIQQILKGNRQGYKQDKANPERPLNAFIRCSECDEKMSGYEVKKKGIHYYKCQHCWGVSINADTTLRAKGEGAHDLFKVLLSDYTLPNSFNDLFKAQLKLTYETLNKEKGNEAQGLKRELEKQMTDLKTLNRRYATDEDFDKSLYREMKLELETKISSLNEKIHQSVSKISNLDKYIEISEEIAKNISKYWASEDLDSKKRIQELVFVGGLSLDVKNRAYLTKKVNYVFALSAEFTGDAEGVNEKRQPISRLPSSMVAGE